MVTTKTAEQKTTITLKHTTASIILAQPEDNELGPPKATTLQSGQIDPNKPLSEKDIFVVAFDFKSTSIKTDYRRDNLRGQSFRGKNLREAVFTQVTGNSISFQGALLAGANFQKASLPSADFRWADLSPLQNPGFTNTHATDLSDASLLRAKFDKANLKGAIFNKADLTNASLIRASAGAANFSNAILINANLFKADLTEAKFDKTHLTNANLSGADLSGVDLRTANLKGADFTGAILRGTRFKKESLEVLKNKLSQDQLKAIRIDYSASASSKKLEEKSYA